MSDLEIHACTYSCIRYQQIPKIAAVEEVILRILQRLKKCLIQHNIYMDSKTYPNSRFGQVRPHRDLLARRHVRVPVPREGRLELLELLAGEVRPLPPLPLVLLIAFVV